MSVPAEFVTSGFCTPKDVRDALTPGGGVTDSSTAAGLDEAQLADAIDEATGVVKTYLSRYAIPTATVEQDGPRQVAAAPVRYWTRNIAAYLATLTFKRGKDVPPDEPVRLRYNQTMVALIAVRDGSMDLDFPLPVSDSDGDALVINQYTGTMFGPGQFGLTTEHHVRPYHIWPGGS